MDDLELIDEPHMGLPDTSADDVHLLDWDCPEKLKFLIEGALFATSERITAKSIQMLFPDEARPNMIEIKEALSAIQDDYAQRAVELHSSDLGYRFQVKQAATPLVKTMLTEKPLFLDIIPSGAPIKINTKLANGIENFLCSSTLYLLIEFL